MTAFRAAKCIDTNESLMEIYVAASVGIPSGRQLAAGEWDLSSFRAASTMKNWIVSCAALAACPVPLHAGGASAAPIEYIFTGTGTGTLDDIAFDGAFTVFMLADTSTVTSGGGANFETPAPWDSFPACSGTRSPMLCSSKTLRLQGSWVSVKPSPLSLMNR